MNSNVVYASMCHNGDGATAPYGSPPQHYDLAAQVYFPAAPAESPYGPISFPDPRTPPLHGDSLSHHQIINDNNGLSYTNLDQQAAAAAAAAGYLHGGRSGAPNGASMGYGSPGGASPRPAPTTATTGFPYRGASLDYAHMEPVAGHGVHHAATPADHMSDRGAPMGGYPPSYLDPLALQRRNGYAGYATSDGYDAVRESCQHNGAAAAAAAAAAYHQATHGLSRTGLSPPKPAPVPTYKWMQVKRNVPKPCKSLLPSSLLAVFCRCFRRCARFNTRCLSRKSVSV